MIVTDEGVDASGARIAEVKNLAVAPEFQRRGVGRALPSREDGAASSSLPKEGT